MKLLTASIVLTLLTLGAATASEAPAVLEYDVIAVKRKLLLETADGDRALQVGDQAQSGDVLRTGSRSRAELAVIEYSAKLSFRPKQAFGSHTTGREFSSQSSAVACARSSASCPKATAGSA